MRTKYATCEDKRWEVAMDISDIIAKSSSVDADKYFDVWESARRRWVDSKKKDYCFLSEFCMVCAEALGGLWLRWPGAHCGQHFKWRCPAEGSPS